MLKTIEVEEKICRRCLGAWIAKVENPKRCALCKTPFWNKPRLRTGDVGARNKYGFDEIKLNEWSYFPYFLDKNDAHGVDWEANGKRARSLEQFMRRKNWTYVHKNGFNENKEVCLMIMRTS